MIPVRLVASDKKIHMTRLPRDVRARSYRRTLILLTALAIMLSAGSPRSQGSFATGVSAQSAPQTGGPRRLWPQRPGPDRTFQVQAPVPAAQAPQFVQNEVLVQFRPGAGDAARAQARDAVGAVLQTALRRTDGGLELLTTSLPVTEAIEALQSLPQVEFAEPNWIVYHQATSDDPFYTNGSLWGMYGDSTSPSNQFGSQAGELWAKGFTGSSSVYVGVIDEGIDFNHPDLAANIWTNPFDPVDGVDNDNNGYVDDVHGWDFVNNDNSVYDGSPSDTAMDSHGTHVAGTIGARGGNGAGVAGINWTVTIISAKFLGPTSGTTAGATAALNYIVDLKTQHNLDIIATNNSWGGGGYSMALHQAIIRAAKNGILFVAAAGNNATDNDSIVRYPSNYATDISAGSESAATYDGVIAVASITSGGALSSFSNYGATTVDIGAPGSAIWSTTPQDTYRSFSGTSMATPHVTGAVAVYKAMNPSASAQQVRGVLLWHGISTSSLNAKTVTGSRLNVGDMTSTALPSSFTKSSPTDGAIGLGTSIVLAWGSTSGATSYEYCIDATNDSACTGGWTSAGSSTSATVTLEHATAYFWQVRAVNTGGPAEADSGTWWTALTLGAATYSSTLKVPQCPGLNTACDSGVLLNGRDGIGSGAEPNQPNTLQASCADGTSGTYHSAESIDRIRVSTIDGTTLGPGKSVTIDVTTWIYSATGDRLDLYYSANAASPSWTFITTVTPSGTGPQTLSATYALPGGAVQAVRAQLRFEGTASSACVTGSFNDHDDLAFRVQGDAFTDNTLTPGVHSLRAIHIGELRTRINALRAQYGLSAASWTDATLGSTVSVKAVHLTEMRTALNAVYSALSRTPPAYTEPTLVAGSTVIKAVHITELRSALMALE
jgi:subtilisin family serine protease